MDDVTRALLSSWSLRPLIIVPLVLQVVVYVAGWIALRRRGAQLAKVWRLLFYLLGMSLVSLSLLSPIDVLSGYLFSMHMVQHLLLGMFAPPLIMLAEPLPVSMWGIPSVSVRQSLGRVIFTKPSPIRAILAFLSKPIVAWGTFFIFLWGWHDANMYDLTLRYEWVHDLEHATFYFSALLLWWQITGAAPLLNKRFSLPARIAFTLCCVPINMILGVAIAMSTKVIYTFYETVPIRLFGMSPITDQALGGALMWVPGSMMYVIATVALIGIWLTDEEKKQPLNIKKMHDEGHFDAPTAI